MEMSGAAALGSGGPVLLASAGVGHEGETLARVRGLATLSLKTSNAIGDGLFGAIGMAIVTTAAATAGVGSIPTPITEAGWDGWLLHQYLAVEEAIVAGQAVGAFDRRVLDSKAMRKANEDESIILVWDGAVTGTMSAAVQVRVRVLSMIG